MFILYNLFVHAPAKTMSLVVVYLLTSQLITLQRLVHLKYIVTNNDTMTLRSSREAEPILTVTLTKIHKEVQINTVVCACVVGMLTARLLLRKMMI